MTDKSNPKLLCLILLFVSTFLVYWQITGNEFINFDDGLYITNNPWVKDGLTIDGMIWAFDLDYKGGLYWHPLAWLSHMTDVELFGLNPGGHHFVSMMFHIICSMLLFLTLNLMTGSVWKSFFTASLFALHPLNADTVAWAAERKNLLSTLFWMLTVLSYIYYASRPNFIKYLLVVIVFLLGILSKPMLVTLPCALLLLDYWPLRRFQWASYDVQSLPQFHQSPTVVLIAEKLPMLAISLIATMLVSGSLGNDFISFAELPFLIRIENALVSYVAYLIKLIYPMDLTVFYPFPKSLPLWQPVFSGILLAVISLVCIRLFRKAPYLLIGWLWYAGTLFPVSGIVQAGLWPAMADRWGYVPLIGIFIVIAWGIPAMFDAFWPKLKKPMLSVMIPAILIFYMSITYSQVHYWKNSTTLFNHALDVTHQNFIAHHNLGAAALSNNNLDKAIQHFRKAVAIKPDFMESYVNLGNIMADKGKPDDAIEYYKKSLFIEPGNTDTLIRIGNMFLKKHRTQEAMRYYRQAIEIVPRDIDAYCNMGNAFFLSGDTKSAIHCYNRAFDIDPSNTNVLRNLGLLYSKTGNQLKAIDFFNRSLKVTPDAPGLHKILADELLQKGNINKAIIHYSKALESDPNDAAANYNMAIAQYYNGNKKSAVAYIKRALDLNPEYTRAKTTLDKLTSEDSELPKDNDF